MFNELEAEISGNQSGGQNPWSDVLQTTWALGDTNGNRISMNHSEAASPHGNTSQSFLPQIDFFDSQDAASGNEPQTNWTASTEQRQQLDQQPPTEVSQQPPQAVPVEQGDRAITGTAPTIALPWGGHMASFESRQLVYPNGVYDHDTPPFAVAQNKDLPGSPFQISEHDMQRYGFSARSVGDGLTQYYSDILNMRVLVSSQFGILQMRRDGQTWNQEL